MCGVQSFSHLSRWYAFLGMFDVAITHMLEILACGHQSKATQELFLRDFFQIVQVFLVSFIIDFTHFIHSISLIWIAWGLNITWKQPNFVLIHYLGKFNEQMDQLLVIGYLKASDNLHGLVNQFSFMLKNENPNI